jgi:hypothetical protein
LEQISSRHIGAPSPQQRHTKARTVVVISLMCPSIQRQNRLGLFGSQTKGASEHSLVKARQLSTPAEHAS